MSTASEILQHRYEESVVDNHNLEQELSRLEAKVGQLNLQVRRLRDELSDLNDPPSYVGEVIKLLGNHKCLVKVSLLLYFLMSFRVSLKVSLW
jgi:ATP-dependent 26S proteasome regulatory subunit